jgi:pimeloyl-ACP methyl ester carboxylesterase
MSHPALRSMLCGVLLAVAACSPRAIPVPPSDPPVTEVSGEAASQTQQPRIEEITFQSGSFTLVGDLWLPGGPGPYPVILLNQGSGMDNRTNNGFTLPMMERMLQAGYAVFSWDKPGVGDSTGHLSSARVLHERAQILLDAIEVMKARPDIDPHRIGLEGGSQAGYVMSLVLSTSQDIAFMICNSCPGMSGFDQSTYQAMALALCTGTPEGQADRRQELLAELDAARTYETYDAYVHYREVIEALFGTALSVPQGYGFEVVPEEAWRLNDPEQETWWDPMEVIRHTTIPVLVLLGDQDRRMDPLQAAYAWREALEEAGNPNSRVELFPSANHDIVVSETGCPDDDQRWLEAYVRDRGYESLAAAMSAIQENPELTSQFPYAPGYLDTIEEWLRELDQ